MFGRINKANMTITSNNTGQVGKYHFYKFANIPIVFFEQYGGPENNAPDFNHMYGIGEFEDLIELEPDKDKWFAIYPVENSFDVITTKSFCDIQNALNNLRDKLKRKGLLKEMLYKVAQKKINNALEIMKNAS
jgi:hypothetical protein